MLTNTILALASAGALVRGAVLPARFQDASPSSLVSRAVDVSWDAYHQANAAYATMGICRVYLVPTSRDGNWPCYDYCKGSNTITCWADREWMDVDTMQGTNPDGEKYYLGECQCGSKTVEKLAETLVDWTAMGLDIGFDTLGAVSCGVLWNVAKDMVQIGSSFIPGTGQVAVAARTMTKAAKLAAKQSDGKSKWNQFVRDTCGADDEGHNEDVAKAFDIMEKSIL